MSMNSVARTWFSGGHDNSASVAVGVSRMSQTQELSRISVDVNTRSRRLRTRI